jgi:hypothetical protein
MLRLGRCSCRSRSSGDNHDAVAAPQCEKQLEIVPGATHLFEEPGTLEMVALPASNWIVRHLPAVSVPPVGQADG